MFKSLIKEESILSLAYLLRWIVIAVVMSTVSSLLVHIFIGLMNIINSGIDTAGAPEFLWTVGSALPVVLGVYTWAPDAVIESVPAYIRGLNKHRGRFRMKDTAGKFAAALFTLSFLGNGGIVGPLGRICAGTGSFIVSRLKRFRLREEDYKLASICGFSAAAAAIFHSPVAAGILAVEICQKTGLNYRRLFPSILTSSLTVFICRSAGFQPFYAFDIPRVVPEPMVLGPVFIMAVFSGFLGRFYNVVYKFLSRHLGRRIGKNRLYRAALAGGVVTFLAGLAHHDLVGTSRLLFDAVIRNTWILYDSLNRGIPLFWVAVLLLTVKILSNSVIVASGYSAGFIGTMMLAGMLLGTAFSDLFGIAAHSADYFALVTAGFAGVLASCTNVPIAAAVLATELFGFSFGMPAAVAAIIGFQINRHNTIYD